MRCHGSPAHLEKFRVNFSSSCLVMQLRFSSLLWRRGHSNLSQSLTNQSNFFNLSSNFLYFLILQLVPDSPPTDISVRSDNSTVLDVLWNPIPQENQNGVILGYHILLSGARGESLRNVTFQNSRQTYYQFQDLQAWTNYSVKVRAFTSKGNGPYSASLFANTEEDGKLNNLIILKINVVTLTCALFLSIFCCGLFQLLLLLQLTLLVTTQAPPLFALPGNQFLLTT